MSSIRKLFILILVLSAFAGWPLSAADGDVAARHAEIYREVAQRGGAATVGIYCRLGRLESYFGTGVVITRDGYVLTSTTVVPEGATDIEIFFTDRRYRTATIVEVAAKVESTLLKIDAEGEEFPHLPLSDTVPTVGERAYTLGNAYSIIRNDKRASFSVGVVSGVYDVKSADSLSSYAGPAIETNAAVNPGLDGGPLLDSSGRVAGIVSMSYSDTRWQGVAVPIGRIREKLRAFADETLEFDTAALVVPPPDETGENNPIAKCARGYAAALVGLRVERKLPVEVLPCKSFAEYRASIQGWDDLTEQQQNRHAEQYYQTMRLYDANRQVRRPGTPVTGVVVSPDGLIVTSLYNVGEDIVFRHKHNGVQKIEFAAPPVMNNPTEYASEMNPVEKIEALLPDGRKYEAKLIARHIPIGIAVLKIEAENLAFVDLAKDAVKPRLGEQIGLMGYVAGAGNFTLNTGIVSSADRSRNLQFQFDALTNYGNSGGPIVNNDGKIVGIALQASAPAPVMGRLLLFQELQAWQIAPNSGVSFGANIEETAQTLPRLARGETVERIAGPFVGVSPQMQSAYSKIVKIESVEKGSPGEKAGLEKNDIILKVGDKSVSKWKDLVDEIARLKVGDKIRFLVRKAQPPVPEIGGRKLWGRRDIAGLMRSMKAGQEFEGRFVDPNKEIVVTLGERTK